MGKVPGQKRVLGSARNSPLAAVGDAMKSIELASGGNSELTTDNLLELKDEIMSNLQSDKSAAKECGAILFANLLQANKRMIGNWTENANDEVSIKKSHFGDITRTLAPLLLDDKPSVRVATAEALR